MLSHIKEDSGATHFAGKLTSKSTGRSVRKWDCPLDEILVGEYFIVPLISTKMLKIEGLRMSNCCRDYSRQCAELKYSIFSIRSRSGERLATLGLKNDHGYWRFDQCLGPANSEVLEETLEYYDDEGVPQTECYPTELYYVAHDVVRLMNSEGFH